MPGGDTILLTGATGFVGRHVLARLLDRGLPVVATASPAVHRNGRTVSTGVRST